MRKLKLNERNIIIDSFEQLVHYSESDYSRLKVSWARSGMRCFR